jgi:cytochrome P450
MRDRLVEDPYPVYAQFRSSGPVQWSEPDGHWYVLGHREAMAALRDTRLASPTRPDAAVHARRRALVQNTCTAAFVELFRPYAAQVVAPMFDQAAARSGMELVDDLASPLALAVMCAVLGLPDGDRHTAGVWVRSISESLAPARGHRMCPHDAGPVGTSPEVRRGLTAAIAARRTDRRDDLISGLLRAAEDGDQFGDDELLDICAELLVSAHDSTVNLIGNAVTALLDNPIQLNRLRAEPGLITTGVEEFLRYDSPTQRVTRVAAEAVELGGQIVGKGDIVVVLIGAANRDPEVFDTPDLLDLSRSPNHHLAFGRGPQFCLGAPLARMLCQLAVGNLAERFAGLRTDGPADRRPGLGARGFTRLPLAL